MFFKILLVCHLLIDHGLKIHAEGCPEEQNKPWSYSGENGPSSWGENYPDCKSAEQSPINIVTDKAEANDSLYRIDLGSIGFGIPYENLKLTNTGYTVNATVTDGDEYRRGMLMNGKNYHLISFHFHWGNNYSRGAEHRIDRKQYAMEMQYFFTTYKYEIAIISVIFQQNRNPNPLMDPIVDNLKNIKYKGDEYVVQDFASKYLFPNEYPLYYAYQGSLTNPPCENDVIWMVVKGVVSIGRAQVDEFRKLISVEEENDDGDCLLMNNYRPVQPLNDRTVYYDV